MSDTDRHGMLALLRTLFTIGRTIFLAVGLLLLAAGAFVLWDSWNWLDNSVEAQGSVIEMVRIRDRDSGSVSYAPLVNFRTADGRTVEFQSAVSSNPPAYTVGETVRVLYDPDRPASAAVAGMFSIWGTAIIVGIIGAVFMAFAAGFAFVVRRLRSV
jgi:hypothetical protein